MIAIAKNTLLNVFWSRCGCLIMPQTPNIILHRSIDWHHRAHLSVTYLIKKCQFPWIFHELERWTYKRAEKWGIEKKLIIHQFMALPKIFKFSINVIWSQYGFIKITEVYVNSFFLFSETLLRLAVKGHFNIFLRISLFLMLQGRWFEKQQRDAVPRIINTKEEILFFFD